MSTTGAGSVFFAFLAASVSDVPAEGPASLTPVGTVTTGHPFFAVSAQPGGTTWVQAVVTLGATPPVITGSAGFVWTLRHQVQFADAWLSVWSAPIAVDMVGDVVDVALSETCDSGIGFAFTGVEPT